MRALSAVLPDTRGRFGPYGGRFVPELLVPALERLEEEARQALGDPRFRTALEGELQAWAGRPTALTPAKHLSRAWGAAIWLKREDLAHTGAHKINNALGQALLATRLGVRRVVAETGAGQHGVACAAACARVGLPCTVFMGAVDVKRQAQNVARIRALGAALVVVDEGDATLRAAIDEALRAWVTDPHGTYYLLGSAVGPHPYPWLVRELQTVIGKEARAQIQERTGALPDAVIACVGGGSNAIGLFHPFLEDAGVERIGIEAEGAATLAHGRNGVLHGCFAPVLQDAHGQVLGSHSAAPGLDYSGVGPEHALLRDRGAVRYTTVGDAEAFEARDACCRLEGILPALESAHALAGARREAKRRRGSSLLVGLSGRGDKDIA